MAGKAVLRKFGSKVGFKNARAYLYGQGAPTVDILLNGEWKSLSIGDAIKTDNQLISKLKTLPPGRERSDTVTVARSYRAALNHMAGINT